MYVCMHVCMCIKKEENNTTVNAMTYIFVSEGIVMKIPGINCVSTFPLRILQCGASQSVIQPVTQFVINMKFIDDVIIALHVS